MEVSSLISLCEGVMIGDTISIISETSEVWLGPLLLFNGNSDNFYLVIGEADLDLKLVRHDEFISFD